MITGNWYFTWQKCYSYDAMLSRYWWKIRCIWSHAPAFWIHTWRHSTLCEFQAS